MGVLVDSWLEMSQCVPSGQAGESILAWISHSVASRTRQWPQWPPTCAGTGEAPPALGSVLGASPQKGHWGAGGALVSRARNKHVLWGVRELGVLSIKKWMLRGCLLIPYNYKDGVANGTQPLLPRLRWKEERKCAKMCQTRSRLEKIKAAVGVARHWNKLPRKVVITISGRAPELFGCGTWGYGSGVIMVMLVWWLHSNTLEVSSILDDAVIPLSCHWWGQPGCWVL